MPTIYEPDILEEFADRLYKQADKLVSHYIVSSAAAGFFLGAIAGVGIGFILPVRGRENDGCGGENGRQL